MFSDSWNRKNGWGERIPNRKKNVFRIGGNTFYDQKNKIPMKILESKRSKIGKIAEFRGIPNRFPNLDSVEEMQDHDIQQPTFFKWLLERPQQLRKCQSARDKECPQPPSQSIRRPNMFTDKHKFSWVAIYVWHKF